MNVPYPYPIPTAGDLLFLLHAPSSADAAAAAAADGGRGAKATPVGDEGDADDAELDGDELFDALDVNKDGVLSRSEFSDARAIRKTRDEASELFDKVNIRVGSQGYGQGWARAT